MLTAEASVRVSACALATRARVWTLAYSGIAIAARMPMMATTIISSMSVKPRWLPSTFRCLWNFRDHLVSLQYMGPIRRADWITAILRGIRCIRDATQSLRAFRQLFGYLGMV